MTVRLPSSLASHPRLSQWLRFDADTVAVFTGKVELGQGILTALTQMAADELSVDIGRIRLLSGRTSTTPDENYTAGSHSVEISGTAIRLVCAQVRQALVALAAAELRVAPDRVAVEDGRATVDGSPSGIDYWNRAAAIDLDTECRGEAPLRTADTFRYIGKDLPRVDLLAKVTGSGFIHDVKLPGMRHARVLRGPIRGALLEALDRARLDKLEGIQVVETGRFLAVVADTAYSAERALSIIEAEAQWQAGSQSEDMDSENWHRTQPTADRILFDPPASVGANDFVGVAVSRPYLAHGSIGPSCAVARISDGNLEVWTHSQGVGPLKRSLAKALGLEPKHVTVFHAQGAGCYGHNGADDVAFDAAFLATRFPGVPIRVQWSRKDELSISPFGAAMVTEVRAGLAADNAPVDWTVEIWSGTHGNRPGMAGRVNLLGALEVADALGTQEPAPDIPDAVGGGAVRNARSPYALASQTVVHHQVQRPALHSSAMRGLGSQINVLAIESMMDELAARAEVDAIDYRRRLLSDPRARAVLDAVRDRCGWSDRGEAGTGRGLGVAYSRYKNEAAHAAVAVEVEVADEVRLKQVWCSVDAGLVISPDGVRNQIEGGIIQAASWTLKEAVRFDGSGVLTGSWDSYPILRFSEVPPVDIVLLDASGEPPLGVGEAAVGPATAAIVNAVAHALGTRIGHLPLTRERIAQALLG